MDIDKEKIDEAVLALLYLTLHDGGRAWKSFDWDTMNRLHEKGLIANPVGKWPSQSCSQRTVSKNQSVCFRNCSPRIRVDRGQKSISAKELMLI